MSILQWNCRGLNSNFTDFRLLIDEYNPIVVCLQETFLSSSDFNIRGYKSFHYLSQDIGGRACGGASILVRDGNTHSEVKLTTTLQAKAVTISTSNVCFFCFFEKIYSNQQILYTG